MAKKKKKFKQYSTDVVVKKVLLYFIGNQNKQFSYSEVINHFKKKKIIKEQVVDALHILAKQDKLEKIKGKKFKLKSQRKIKSKPIEGFVDMSKSGNGYVVSDAVAKDVYIKAANLNRAMDGDKVTVELFLPRKRTGKQEGKIIEILERAQTDFVGVIHLKKDFAFVVPDKPEMKADFFIPPDKVNGAKEKDKVVVRMLDWNEHQKSPTAEVVEVLGKPGLNDVEMQSILVENGFRLSFPKEVQQELKKLSTEITAEEIAKRRDFRKVLTITIDPEDAKDFDDAISIQALDNGHYEIGVHIADVSHYIQPNTALDKEAFKRSTSVYLVDRVLPMLPERISNVLCSLRPNEEKLSYSAVFEIDKSGKVYNEWFGRTVIYSDRRFTYEEAQEVIETGEGDYPEEIQLLNEIALKLRKKRYQKGAISFETEEVKFKFDEEGKPISVYTKQRKDAHMMIEDFMLLANRSVAEYIDEQNQKTNSIIPYVYRVHDIPDIERLITFNYYADTFGFKVDLDSAESIAKSLNQIMDKVKGTPAQNILSYMAVRCMSKAKYTTENIGHYGLAFKHYTHFTSPIRRYPDVLAHRLLEFYLTKQKRGDNAKIEAQLQHCSLMERKAIKAERTATKYKQVEFLSDKIGEEFEGMISGVKQYGIFVELLGNKCEGLIPIETLPYDQYVYKEAKQTIDGLINNRVFKIGDQLKVKVVKTNMENRTIDMELVVD